MSPTSKRAQTVGPAEELELDLFRLPPIVVGVDGSDSSAGAVAWGADTAARLGRPLVLVHAVEGEPPADLSAAAPDPDAEAALGIARRDAQRVDDTVDIHGRLIPGSAKAVLLDAGLHSEMIVLGRRGLGPVSRLIVGSTSIAVAGRSPAPVVIVPDRWRPTDHAAGPVVVGIDIAEPDAAAIRFAFAQAADLAVDLVAVAAGDSLWAASFAHEPIGEVAEDRDSNAHALLAAAVREGSMAYPAVSTHLVVRTGHAGPALIDAAENGNAQLLVLGARRRSTVTGFPLGSVAREVLHHVQRPIAIVRAHEAV